MRQSRLYRQRSGPPCCGTTGATISPVQLLPAAAGAGDTLPAGGAPCGERLAASSDYLSLPSPGGEGEPPVPCHGPREPRALQEILPERARRPSSPLRSRAARRTARKFCREPGAILPACQRGGRQVPGDSSGLHHPFPDDGGGTARREALRHPPCGFPSGRNISTIFWKIWNKASAPFSNDLTAATLFSYKP